MTAASGNQYTLFAIATSSSHSVPRGRGMWTLQHRDPTGTHWVVIGHFPSKKLAAETARAFVTAGYGTDADFRTRKERVIEP